MKQRYNCKQQDKLQLQYIHDAGYLENLLNHQPFKISIHYYCYNYSKHRPLSSCNVCIVYASRNVA